MVEQSKVLNTAGAEKQTKRELFDALRQELDSPVLEKASKAVWELILDNNGLGKEISDVVERIYRRLSCIELPLPPPSAQAANGNEEKEEKVKGSESSSRKRTFGEMNTQDFAQTVSNGSGDHHPVVWFILLIGPLMQNWN